MTTKAITVMFNPFSSEVVGAPVVRRDLGDVRGTFADGLAYFGALARGDSLSHFTSTMETAADAFRIQSETLPIANP